MTWRVERAAAEAAAARQHADGVSLGQGTSAGDETSASVQQADVGASTSGDDVIVGFAGSTADAMTLCELLEAKLEEHPGQLLRACVELTKEWRTNRAFARVEAMLLAADRRGVYLLSGGGDVLEPADGAVAIGSGGAYALSAAKALLHAVPTMPLKDVASQAMDIAQDICVFTNGNCTVETLEWIEHDEGGESSGSEDAGNGEKQEE